MLLPVPILLTRLCARRAGSEAAGRQPVCGIAGYVAPAGMDAAAPALREMARRIAHRGPDGEGFLEQDVGDGRHRVGLAHRRLAIIDLATGQQPMGNEDGRVQIVFNGEIYNFAGLRRELIALGHQFTTASDTETIIHAWEAWGTGCVDRLEGMFAFAIWDARRQRLFLARDRFGKKPLFMAQHAGALVFASEIKSVLAWPGLPDEIDQDALWHYFEYCYVPGPRTLWRGVHKLPPGSWLLWEPGGMRQQRYWLPADAGAPASPPPLDPVAAYLRELERAVADRMVSDVPFGAFLSGGLDSSAVVALMTRHASAPVRTFAVGFAESAYSELPHARAVARAFGTEHHELVVEPRHLEEHLGRLARFRDAPMTSAADVPIHLLSLQAAQSVKMVLTGEGSDETLGGYPKHRAECHAAAWQRLPRWLRQDVVEPLAAALPARWRRVQTAVAALGIEDFRNRMPRWFGAINADERAALLALQPAALPADDTPFSAREDAGALRRVLFFDQTSWLPDNLLERGDRMTMAASIEARMPFMDHRLAALAASLPDAWRVRGGVTKRVLREGMQRVLPPAILARPKVGFRVPVDRWLRGPLRDFLHDHLASPGSRTRCYYQPAALDRVLAEHDSGRRNHEKLLWCLLNLEVWHRACRPGPADGAADNARGAGMENA